MKLLLILILVVHGLIHLLGFLKGLQLADIPQLNKVIKPWMGFWWLATTVLFLAAAIFYGLNHNQWWMIGGIAMLSSQTLIIIHWQDAKYGTIINGIVLIALLAGVGDWYFSQMVDKEQSRLYSKVQERQSNELITEAELEDLPYPVQNWLKQSNVTGRSKAGQIYLKQEGKLRTSPEGKWMPFNAEQWFTTDPPGFLWVADIQAFPGIHLYGKDRFIDGKGSMTIYLNFIGSFQESTGTQIDQGTMLRYMAEMVWFPQAALHDYMNWEALDSNSAKGTMRYNDYTVSGIYEFSDNGDFQMLKAKRYYDRKEGPTLENWTVKVKPEGHQTINGIRVPAALSVTWNLESGDFYWLDLKITDIKHKNDSL